VKISHYLLPSCLHAMWLASLGVCVSPPRCAYVRWEMAESRGVEPPSFRSRHGFQDRLPPAQRDFPYMWQSASVPTRRPCGPYRLAICPST